MAQHDTDIANASGAAVRADINNALDALFSINSGGTEPGTPHPYMLWADTTANQLKIRNGANSTWIAIGSLDTPNLALATLASPTFTGTVSAPTPATADDSTKVATTAHVQAAAQAKVDAITTVHTNVDGSLISGRTIYIDNDAPTGGANGDVWFEY